MIGAFFKAYFKKREKKPFKRKIGDTAYKAKCYTGAYIFIEKIVGYKGSKKSEHHKNDTIKSKWCA